MHTKRKQKSLYGICRVDNDTKRTHGWLVTIQRRGTIHRKLFSDKKHGGKAAAFAAAIPWRDQTIARHPPLPLKQYVTIQRSNNQSGVPGVCRYTASGVKSLPSGGQLGYWVASWTLTDGQRVRRKFSVKKYGEEKAHSLAIQARQKAVKSLKGNFNPGAARQSVSGT